MALVELNDLAAVIVDELPEGPDYPLWRFELRANLHDGDGGEALQKYAVLIARSRVPPQLQNLQGARVRISEDFLGGELAEPGSPVSRRRPKSGQ